MISDFAFALLILGTCTERVFLLYLLCVVCVCVCVCVCVFVFVCAVCTVSHYNPIRLSQLQLLFSTVYLVHISYQLKQTDIPVNKVKITLCSLCSQSIMRT